MACDSFDTETNKEHSKQDDIDTFLSLCRQQKIHDALSSLAVLPYFDERSFETFGYDSTLLDEMFVRSRQADPDKVNLSNFLAQEPRGEATCYILSDVARERLLSSLERSNPRRARMLARTAAAQFKKQGDAFSAGKYWLASLEGKTIEGIVKESCGIEPDADRKSFCAICMQSALEIAKSDFGFFSILWASILRGDWRSAKALIESSSIRVEDKTPTSFCRTFSIECAEAMILFLERHYPEALTLIRAILDKVGPRMGASIKSLFLYAQAVAYERTGRIHEALNYYLRTEAIAHLADNESLAARGRYGFLNLLFFLGDLSEAKRKCLDALANAKYTEWHAAFEIMLARILLEENALPQALSHASSGCAQLSIDGDAGTYLDALCIKSQILATSGDPHEAYCVMTRAFHLSENHQEPRRADLMVNHVQARIAFMRSDYEDMSFIEMKYSRSIFEEDAFYSISLLCLRAQLAIASSNLPEAIHLVNEATSMAREKELRFQHAQCLLLKTNILLRSKYETEARKTLVYAIEIGRQCGFIRMFIDASPEVLSLLREEVGGNDQGATRDSYLKKLMTACLEKQLSKNDAASQTNAAYKKLTPREAEVLMLLQSGLTRREISESLHISPNTTKRHVSNIYTKLDATCLADINSYTQ